MNTQVDGDIFSLWKKKGFNIKSRVTVAKREYPQKINLAPT